MTKDIIPQDKVAIATLLMNGNSYVKAAIALAGSIQRHMKDRKIKYQSTCDTHVGKKDDIINIELVCLITDDVTDREILLKCYNHVYIVDRIKAVGMPALGGNSSSKIYHWISDAPTKWNIFGLTEYKKVLFLDADMILLDDISSLFSLPCPAAMFDHQSSTNYVENPLWTGYKEKGPGFINWYTSSLTHQSEISPLGGMKTGTTISTESLNSLRLRSNSQFALHGGIILIEPDKNLLHQYKDDLSSIISSLKKPIYYNKRLIGYEKTDRTISSIDEITLALFMHDIGYTWTHIGMEYNVAAYHTYGIYKDSAKIIHYLGVYKPWGIHQDGITERQFLSDKVKEGKEVYQIHHETTELWYSYYEDAISRYTS